MCLFLFHCGVITDKIINDTTSYSSYICINIYPNMTKHQSKPQVYKSDIAPCGQI